MSLVSCLKTLHINNPRSSKCLNELVLKYCSYYQCKLSTQASENKLDSDVTLYHASETSIQEKKPRSNLAHYITPKYNIAAFVSKSYTLQELVKLGVNLHKIERTKGAKEILLRLDFERDIKKYIQFLHDAGVPVDVYGEIITKNPFIFKEDIDNLQVRINYLESKNFSQDDICRIVSKNPLWLSFKTQNIDNRLGFFQGKFHLEGPEVRFLTVRMPKIITSDLSHIEETYFSVKEELGFVNEEIKALILNKPKIFTLSRKSLIERFCYLHTSMGLDHKDLIRHPEVLLCRLSRIRERHEFLKELNRNQYNSQKPGYISPTAVVSGSDSQFCEEIGKVSVATYNKFLKTLF